MDSKMLAFLLLLPLLSSLVGNETIFLKAGGIDAYTL